MQRFRRIWRIYKREIVSRVSGGAMSCIFNDVLRNVHVGTMFRATHARFCEPFASVNYKSHVLPVVKSMKVVTFALSTSSRASRRPSTRPR